MDIVKVLILLRLLLRFIRLQTLAKMWHFLLAVFLWCVDIKVKVSSSFKMNSKQFCCFDNFNSLLWGYYSIGFWILLALKFTIRIIGRGDMAGTKLERRRGWKKKIMKDFCCLDLKCSFRFCFTSNFHRVCLNLYEILFMS